MGIWHRVNTASVWSSCAYSQKINRIYVGTGNADPDHQLPNAAYASEVLALDATSGAFKGFFQPSPSDSYRPDDLDVDTPPSPLLFSRAGNDVLAIDSKNGSFFLLDPNTMQAIKRRQLLPRIGGDGFPGDGSTPIPLSTLSSRQKSYWKHVSRRINKSCSSLMLGT